jgi:hypothetical protein
MADAMVLLAPVRSKVCTGELRVIAACQGIEGSVATTQRSHLSPEAINTSFA